MNLHLLHTVSGAAIILSLLLKILLHYYLDYVHGRSVGVMSMFIFPRQYFIPYKSAVDNDHTKLKYLCNFFFVLSCISFILNVIVGIQLS